MDRVADEEDALDGVVREDGPSGWIVKLHGDVRGRSESDDGDDGDAAIRESMAWIWCRQREQQELARGAMLHTGFEKGE